MRPVVDRIWTESHRGAVIVLLIGLVGLLGYRYVTRQTYVTDPLPAEGPRASELPKGLDPNSAPWERLSLLPGLGENKAKAIVEFREGYVAAHPGERAFNKPEDLMQVKGIGPAGVDNLSPYLNFERSERDRVEGK